MKIFDILNASKGKLFGTIDLNEDYSEIKTDSRKVLNGDIFIDIATTLWIIKNELDEFFP